MAELLTNPSLYDVNYLLEVTFTEESAVDYGGPRKEFLGCAMREIRNRLFEETANHDYKLFEDQKSLYENHYYRAGLIFGKLNKLPIFSDLLFLSS